MPSVSTVHINQLLPDFGIRPWQTTDFIAAEVYAPKLVQKRSDKVAWIDKTAEGLRDVDLAMGDTADHRVLDFAVDTETSYSCAKYGAEGRVSWAEIANADAPINAYMDKTSFIVNKILLKREIQMVAKVVADFTSSQTTTPSNKWDDYTNGDPFNDLQDKCHAVAASCGAYPNRLALDYITLQKITDHPDVLDRIKYTAGGVLPNQEARASLLAQLLGLERIVVARNNFKNTAASFGATPSFARVWGDYAFLYRYEPPTVGTKTAGVHFVWANPELGGQRGQDGMLITTGSDEKRKYDWIVAELYYDQQTLQGTSSGQAAGHLFANTLSAI